MFNSEQYKKLVKIYMDKHNVSYIKAINEMDLKTAEKLFNKLKIDEYMEQHNVSYVEAQKLIDIEQINEYMKQHNVSYTEAIKALERISNYNISIT